MDQYTLSKLGNVTIEKVSIAENPENANASVSTEETSPDSNIPHEIQLPKLPSSINITLKPNINASDQDICDSAVNDETIQNEFEEGKNENCNFIHDTSSKCEEDGFKMTETQSDASSSLNSPIESSSEICDNIIEAENDVNMENTLPNDCQELSESNGEELDETKFSNVSSDIIDHDQIMMDLKNSEEEKDSSNIKYDEEPQLPEIKDEFTGIDEYGEAEGALCSDELPEVPVNELIEGELPESVILKEEFSDKESDNASDDADDELDSQMKTDEHASSSVKRKKKRKSKSEENSEESTNANKKQKTSTEKTDSEEKEKPSSELKVGNLRRNIREVMDETKLDEATLAAQMQEKERLRRVQEQLRANRDIQRQMMQAKVLSLIETGGTPVSEEISDVEDEKPNTVVVKLNSGSGAPQIVNKKMLDLLKKQNNSSDSEEEDVSMDKFANLSRNLHKPQMMTASVSIAPVKSEQIIYKEEDDEDDFEEDIMETMDDDEKPKNKEIVMISSSSEEDDDCIVISEDEESEQEEDTSNSGMHTNDLYNVPDDQGRVLINVGHPENEKDVFLAPQIGRIIKPHQIGGVRFLFDNIVESLDRYRTSEGFGCILAHSMGLGKTLQVISFCDVFLRYTEGRSVLCIMPINTLQNWVAEFNMWLPIDPETSPLKEQGEVLARQFPLFVLNDNQKTLSARANVIQNWFKEGGVLLIGYELYRQLCLKKSPKSRLRSKKRIEIEDDVDDEKSKTLLDTMFSALVKPGPDLVICDEGHRIKNSHASISQALKQIRSKRRVVLTGYPLQNNLLEYWCMVDFVRPNYLGTKTEFSNMFERPIQNGQCIDSTPQDVKLMRYRAHVLHSLLEGFVQRRSHRVLQQTLPSKYEFVLLLRMTPFQKKLYNTFMNEVVRTKAVPNPLKAFAVCCKIWNHPDILYNFLKKRAGEEDIDLDLDEAVPSIGTPGSGPSTPMTPSTPPHLSASKRSRTRGRAKDKPVRKNARTSTPQPINKPPSIAAVPPNSANNPKPPNPEHAITNANNQPIPPFNSSYNSNQFQNFDQSTSENVSFGQSSTSQNFNAPYSQQQQQQEYSSNQSVNSNNPEYNNSVSYPQQQQQPQPQQQNYGEGNNYYQSEYNQSNYWQGNADENNYYSNSSSSNSGSSTTDNYYPSQSSSSQSSSQPYSNEFSSSQGETSQTQHYSGQNFNYDVNTQPLQYSREFPPKQDINNLQNFNANNNAGNMEASGMMTDLNSPVYPSDNYSGHQSSNAEINVSHYAPGSNVPRGSATDTMPFNPANRDMYSSQGASEIATAVPSDEQVPQNFNSFATPPTVPPPKRRPGRPPSQSPRAVAIRQKRAANLPPPNPSSMAPGPSAQGSSGGTFPPMFKPGLPGGAPLKAANSQNFSVTPDPVNVPGAPQSHLLPNNDINTNYPPGQQINMQNMPGNEGMWSGPAAANQNAVYPDSQHQNYDMYNEMPPQNSNFIPNETSTMMSGSGPVRDSRNLLGNIQHNEIFNPPEGGYAQNNAENNLFGLGSYNYLNDLQMPGHTSFMGLLEGVDSMDINHSNVASSSTSSSSSSATVTAQGIGRSQCEANSNYAESSSGMSYPSSKNASVAGPSGASANKSVTYADTGRSDTSVAPVPPAQKDINDSIIGLARKSQITLKKVGDKKSEKLTQSPPEKSGPSTSVSSSPEFSQPQQQQNRLPSVDMFNAGQNFAGSGSSATNASAQETGNFNQTSQYGFNNKNSSGTSSSLSTQTNWDSYGNFSNEFNVQNVGEKPQNFVNYGGGSASVSHDLQRNKTKAMQFERPSHRISSQEENFDSASSRDSTNKDRLALGQNVNLMGQNQSKKPVDDEVNHNYYQTGSNVEMEQNVKTPFAMNVSAGSSVVKLDNKKVLLQKRTPQIGHVGDIYNPEQMKNDSDDMDFKMIPPEMPHQKSGKEEPGIPYEWTAEFFKDYDPGKIEASAKTLVFFCMLDEIIRLGDRLLLFSQSLFTLDLIEDFLHLINIPTTEEKWARNKSYFRLDGSTTALEREKLINEFNQNPNVHLFLVSTRAGSLGINLVGANRVVVFDASWNPCHDTQAVCRVYRYGQQKSCYVYRFVTDNCLEKKIYDRQINKQGMSDRIVDECNPDAHLTIKDVSNLCWDDIDVTETKNDFSEFIDKYDDVVIKKVIKECGALLSKEPFQHESLLVDRADKKLSQAEKRMAKRGYELEKQASLKPVYGIYNPPLGMQNRMGKPMASVRPMLADHSPQRETVRRWIPAEVWQKQGMSAQEMTLPLDVVIPTSTTDNRSSIVLKAGQKVMVLKSHKGIYMQLENGKIIAIKTALKPGGPVAGNKQPGIPARPPNPPMPMNKMQPKPPMDRTLAALSNRRDVTVSPIRNRFPMRPTPSVPPMSNVPSRPPIMNRNTPRPSVPIVRTFPLSRSQNRPVPRMNSPLPQPATPQQPNKQIFGPNSAVTISVANKKKMESQMRVPVGVSKDEYGRNYDKEGTSHLTEVNYDDYNSGTPLRESTPRAINDIRKTSHHLNDYTNPPSDGYGSGRSAYGHPSTRDNRNPSHATSSRNPSHMSDVIPESLKYKKDINLTPVMKNVSIVDKSVSIVESAKPKLPSSNIPYHHQQQQLQQPPQQHQQPSHSHQHQPSSQQQPQQQHHQQPPPLPSQPPQQHYQMASQSNKMATSANVPKTHSSGRGIKQSLVNVGPKKDMPSSTSTVVPGKNVELPKSSAQHSISIFPVGKKGVVCEETTGTMQQSAAASFASDQSSYTQQQQPPSKSDYYSSNYGNKQFGNYPTGQPSGSGGGSSAESQFSNPYYQPGYQSQPDYAATPQQSSFSGSGYQQQPTPAPPTNAYVGDNFGSAAYGAENSAQYSNAVYPSQSSSTQNTFDQYGSYYPSQQSARPAQSSQSSSQ